MGCTSCGSGDGSPKGCKSNGGCSSSSCNKMNSYDWLSDNEISDPTGFKLVEISFKKGSSKDFFINNNHEINTGDMVAVEGDKGFNVGEITLSGELVRMQLKKKGIKADDVKSKVLRKASENDLQKLAEARELEIPTLVRARVIARNLNLGMKIGDIEFQADKRKATFFYTAEGRIDFRELVRHYSDEFKLKVEMRQIGARQESARIGGLGSCGRELCCSTWLSKFKSVSTTAARYQNLSINQTKLSGQCGRLKCCLNYELDTYLDILKEFPKKVDYLKTKHGKAQLVKMDIFKGLMFYSLSSKKDPRGVLVGVDKERVREIKEMNKKGEFPENLLSKKMLESELKNEEDEITFADVTGQIELPAEKKRNKRRNNKRKSNRNKSGQKNNRGANNKNTKDASGKPKATQSKGQQSKKGQQAQKGTQPKKGSSKSRNTNTKSGSKPNQNRNRKNSKAKRRNSDKSAPQQQQPKPPSAGKKPNTNQPKKDNQSKDNK